MNELQKDITHQALQINTGVRVKLTKGQSALLKAIRMCVSENKPLAWETIIHCFYDNVSQEGRDWNANWNIERTGYNKDWYRYDIMDAYKANNSHWQYHVKPRIRQWFVSTIGILVIKNQLIIIPTIEMD